MIRQESLNETQRIDPETLRNSIKESMSRLLEEFRKTMPDGNYVITMVFSTRNSSGDSITLHGLLSDTEEFRALMESGIGRAEE